jgi:hypothetical protein
LPFDEANTLIDACRLSADRLAEEALHSLVDRFHPIACALLTNAAKPLPGRKEILASHALIHTAEGEMFRQALIHGAETCGLAVHKLRERDGYALAAEAIGIPETTIRARIAALGASLGPPWREDQKLAALAGWIAALPRP